MISRNEAPMHIDPIHAGPVALAHVLLVASRTKSQINDGSRRRHSAGTKRNHRFSPLHALRQWWRKLDAPGGHCGNPLQLMLWAECWGRPYSASIGLVLLINHLRKNRVKNSHG
jgi:hypothetical protein